MIIFLCIIACVVIYLVLQFTGKSGEKCFDEQSF